MMPRQDCPVCGNRPRVFAERLQAQAIARLTAELEAAKKNIVQARAEGFRAGLEAAAKVCAERAVFLRESYFEGGTAAAEALTCERDIRALLNKEGGGT